MVTITSAYQDAFARSSAVRPRSARPSVTGTLVGMLLGFLAGWSVRAWRAVQPLTFTLAGFGCLVAAGFQRGTVWGFAAAGVSLLVLEYRIRGE